MKQGLSLFPAHLRVGIAEHESNCGEEVTLAGAISPDDDIMLWRKGFDHRLLAIAAFEVSTFVNDLLNCQKADLLKPWIMICLICISATRNANEEGQEKYGRSQAATPDTSYELCRSFVRVGCRR